LEDLHLIKPKFRLIAGALVLSLALLSTGCSKQTQAVTEEKYVPVEVSPAATQTLVETTTFSGKVVSDQEVSLVPKMPGKVTAVNVKVGDKVQAGTVLFTLDTTDLKKSVEMASIGVRTAETNYLRTKEQIDLAKVNLERQKELYAAGAISKVQLETAESQASEKPLELAQIQWDQAKTSLAQAQDALNNTVVTAPVTGTVASVNVKYGEMASQAMSAVTITQLDSLNVSLSVPENIVNELKVGQEAKVIVTSAGDKEIKGKVLTIAPSSDARTQLYAVKVAIENNEGVIKPGMFASVAIPTETKENVLTVKSESLVLKNGQNTIFVVEDDRAVAREVVAGLDTGAEVEILKGLQAGDKVIIKGQTLVEQGSKVKVVGGSAS
jgi:RND family efflux transporter MFP subunit